jgi:hypothetical protein
MKIYCGYADTEESNTISKRLHEVGVGWKNIKNEFLELVCFRVVIVPKTKQEKILKLFPEIKGGCCRDWLKPLDTTHYWQDEETDLIKD